MESIHYFWNNFLNLNFFGKIICFIDLVQILLKGFSKCFYEFIMQINKAYAFVFVTTRSLRYWDSSQNIIHWINESIFFSLKQWATKIRSSAFLKIKSSFNLFINNFFFFLVIAI